MYQQAQRAQPPPRTRLQMSDTMSRASISSPSSQQGNTAALCSTSTSRMYAPRSHVFLARLVALPCRATHIRKSVATGFCPHHMPQCNPSVRCLVTPHTAAPQPQGLHAPWTRPWQGLDALTVAAGAVQVDMGTGAALHVQVAGAGTKRWWAELEMVVTGAGREISGGCMSQ